jgi:DNA polymerase II large subunit
MKVPCILCLKKTEATGPNVIANICDTCNTSDIQTVLKNINYKTIKEAIDKSSKQLNITEDGEII